MSETKELQALETAGLVMTAADLQRSVEEDAKKREILKSYISTNLVEGTDYGTVGPSKKPSLFKPGSEKFCSLLHLTPTFEMDKETWAMSGKREGLFCYLCKLVDGRGVVVSEGRGARDLNDPKNNKQHGDTNATIKMAQKSAQIDAVIRLGLSDSFTQDLEDMPKFANTAQEVRVDSKNLDTLYRKEPCPDCGRRMALKTGRSGKFWGCTGYASGECKKTAPYVESEAKDDGWDISMLENNEAPF